ncbi:MAG TPA: hypothetical protein VFQ44_03075 [Streptosporangiaceae bacterium]|nr:hypothetical protein [Streptosporangiaceae bacterium]
MRVIADTWADIEPVLSVEELRALAAISDLDVSSGESELWSAAFAIIASPSR